MKGGKSITYRSRLIVLLGGQLKASIKREIDNYEANLVRIENKYL